MSSKLDIQGHWWLPGREDKKVGGTLRFDSDEGGSLTLIGGLGSIFDGIDPKIRENGETIYTATSDSMQRAGTYPRILGETDGRAVTLEDCFRREAKSNMFGPVSREVVTVNRVYNGIHFEPEQVAGAKGISVRLAYLDDWALEEFIQEEQFYDSSTRKFLRTTLTVEPRDARSVLLDSGSIISLNHVVGWNGRRGTARYLTQGYELSLERADVAPMTTLTDEVSDFQDLLLFATGRNPEFLSVQARHPALFETMPGRKEERFPVPFEVLASWRMRDTAKEPDQIDHRQLFFTLDDLGGMAGIKRWMTVAAQFRSSLGRLTSTKATKSMFVSDRLLNYTAVLEGFDREKTQDQAAHLPERLRRCATIAGEPFKALVGNTGKWAECLAWHRNDIAHHLGRQLEESTTTQIYLSQSAYWLAVHLFLREAQFPDAVFDRLVDHEALGYATPRIKAVVDAYGRTS